MANDSLNAAFFESMRLNRLVDKFGLVMKGRLMTKLADGAKGWDDPANHDLFLNKLELAIDNGRWEDAANYAAMIWYGEQIAHLERDFLTEGNDPEHLQCVFNFEKQANYEAGGCFNDELY